MLALVRANVPLTHTEHTDSPAADTKVPLAHTDVVSFAHADPLAHATHCQPARGSDEFNTL